MQVQNNLANRNQEEQVTKFMVGDDEVKLSARIIRENLVSGGGNVTNQEIVYFIHLCRAMGLNPFIKDAYLIKYGDQPAQTVTSIAAIQKRAEQSQDFDGYQAGIILVKEDGNIEYRPGSFHLKEREKLVGGWADVYKKNRSHPYRACVSFDEYVQRKKNGEVNSMWGTKPGTMIRKVALSQALRDAYPDKLSGLYVQEEMNAAEEPVNVMPVQQPEEMYQEPQQIPEQMPQQFVQPEETYSEPVIERPSFV